MDSFKNKLLLNAMENNGIYIDDIGSIDETLMIDSITFVTLIVDLEEIFDISFEDEDLKKIVENDGVTIRLLNSIIESKIANN